MDALNQHECMPAMLRLLDHMDVKKINPQLPEVSNSGGKKFGEEERAKGVGLGEDRVD